MISNKSVAGASNCGYKGEEWQPSDGRYWAGLLCRQYCAYGARYLPGDFTMMKVKMASAALRTGRGHRLITFTDSRQGTARMASRICSGKQRRGRLHVVA